MLIEESNLDIRNIVLITANSLGFAITNSQIDMVVKNLKEKVEPQNLAKLKFAGKYIKYCKEHPTAKVEIIDGDKPKWICNVCKKELILLPIEEVTKQRKSSGSIILPKDEEELLKKVKSGEIIIENLSAGQKAYVSRLKKREEVR